MIQLSQLLLTKTMIYFPKQIFRKCANEWGIKRCVNFSNYKLLCDLPIDI